MVYLKGRTYLSMVQINNLNMAGLHYARANMIQRTNLCMVYEVIKKSSRINAIIQEYNEDNKIMIYFGWRRMNLSYNDYFIRGNPLHSLKVWAFIKYQL